MGSSQAKLVINQPSKDNTTENGTHEVVEQNTSHEEGTVISPNGNCSNHESTQPCEPDNTKCSKKNSPIGWIQKKISFKKTRTPKKTSTAETGDLPPTETPAVTTSSPSPPDYVAITQTPNTTQEIQISTDDHPIKSHETSEIPLDSATQIEQVVLPHIEPELQHSVPVDSSTSVETTPILNGLCGNHVDANHTPSFEPDLNEVELLNSKNHDPSAESDVSEKLASLQMGTVDLMLSNGLDVATDYTKEEN